jgi:hypothetical protein
MFSLIGQVIPYSSSVFLPALTLPHLLLGSRNPFADHIGWLHRTVTAVQSSSNSFLGGEA